jgi:hypothetical protein
MPTPVLPTGRCLGVFRSSDGGDHWVTYGAGHFRGCGNLNYVNCLAVSPENPDLVVCGARDLHGSIDGGRTWTQVTQWFAALDSRGYSHPDHHALLWPAKERLYSANDGGVDVSVDEGITWRNLTHGLKIAMFYDIDVAASFGSKAGGPEVNSGADYRGRNTRQRLGDNQRKSLRSQVRPGVSRIAVWAYSGHRRARKGRTAVTRCHLEL